MFNHLYSVLAKHFSLNTTFQKLLFSFCPISPKSIPPLHTGILPTPLIHHFDFRCNFYISVFPDTGQYNSLLSSQCYASLFSLVQSLSADLYDPRNLKSRTCFNDSPSWNTCIEILSCLLRYCHSCDVCQRTVVKGRVTKTPLGKMPLIDLPFKRVAVDLVGPIAPVTDRGNRYIDG